MRKEPTTAEVLQGFSQFVTDLYGKHIAAVPGFEGDSISRLIGLRAQKLADERLEDRALELFMNLAKLTLGFRIAVQGGTLTESHANEKVAVAIAETVKYLAD